MKSSRSERGKHTFNLFIQIISLNFTLKTHRSSTPSAESNESLKGILGNIPLQTLSSLLFEQCEGTAHLIFRYK